MGTFHLVDSSDALLTFCTATKIQNMSDTDTWQHFNAPQLAQQPLQDVLAAANWSSAAVIQQECC